MKTRSFDVLVLMCSGQHGSLWQLSSTRPMADIARPSYWLKFLEFGLVAGDRVMATANLNADFECADFLILDVVIAGKGSRIDIAELQRYLPQKLEEPDDGQQAAAA